jgi:hypothetical protein
MTQVGFPFDRSSMNASKHACMQPNERTCGAPLERAPNVDLGWHHGDLRPPLPYKVKVGASSRRSAEDGDAARPLRCLCCTHVMNCVLRGSDWTTVGVWPIQDQSKNVLRAMIKSYKCHELHDALIHRAIPLLLLLGFISSSSTLKFNTDYIQHSNFFKSDWK